MDAMIEGNDSFNFIPIAILSLLAGIYVCM